jgi:flagellar basal-body rod modification protein FlgD
MSVTDSISALAAQTEAASGASKSRNNLDQNSFLKLMIAQFRNQDPTKPKDPSEFLGQLAQFSTVSGIEQMQTSIGALADSLRSASVMNGANLVGRDVLVPNAAIDLAANEPVQGALDVPSGVTTVDVVIKDQAGQLVRRMAVPATGSATSFAWDGVTDVGGTAPAGRYQISATAKTGNTSESVDVLLNTRVNSVTIDPKTSDLILNTRNVGAVPIGSVRRIG